MQPNDTADGARLYGPDKGASLSSTSKARYVTSLVSERWNARKVQRQTVGMTGMLSREFRHTYSSTSIFLEEMNNTKKDGSRQTPDATIKTIWIFRRKAITKFYQRTVNDESNVLRNKRHWIDRSAQYPARSATSAGYLELLILCMKFSTKWKKKKRTTQPTRKHTLGEPRTAKKKKERREGELTMSAKSLNFAQHFQKSFFNYHTFHDSLEQKERSIARCTPAWERLEKR